MKLKIPVFVGQVSRYGFKTIGQVGLMAPPDLAESHSEPLPHPSCLTNIPLGAEPPEKLGDLTLPHETGSGERYSPLKIWMVRRKLKQNPSWQIMKIV